jgi:hypothetical protein
MCSPTSEINNFLSHSLPSFNVIIDTLFNNTFFPYDEQIKILRFLSAQRSSFTVSSAVKFFVPHNKPFNLIYLLESLVSSNK